MEMVVYLFSEMPYPGVMIVHVLITGLWISQDKRDNSQKLNMLNRSG